MQKLEINTKAKEIINSFENLPLGGKSVICPYYINPKTQRANLRVLSGKGSPEEIVLETEIYAKLGGLDMLQMSPEEIRKFMIKRHIGIDCSGFVVHVLNEMCKELYKKPLWSFIKKNDNINIYKRIRYKLRPVENIGVVDLTNEKNSIKISNINEILPGDLIKTQSIEKIDGLHIILVVEVIKDGENVKSITYKNSNRYYDNGNGIRTGEVYITHPGKSLDSQDWALQTGSEKCYEYLGYSKDLSISGVWRLKLNNK